MEEVNDKIRLLKILKGVSIGVLLIVLVTIIIFSYNKKKILYNYITTIDFNKINFKDNLNIENKEVEKYIEFQNIKIRNDFDDYKEKQKTSDTYLITDEKNNSIGIKIIKDSINKIGFESGIDKEDYDKFLNDNNIKNSMDLINYTVKNKDMKINLFSSKSKLVKKAIMRNVLVYYIGEQDSYLLNNGVIQKISEGAIVEIIKDNTSYVITIKTDKNFDYILDLISTISIN